MGAENPDTGAAGHRRDDGASEEFTAGHDLCGTARSSSSTRARSELSGSH